MVSRHPSGAVPGAVVIRSDEIRKRLSGVSPLDRLGPEGYSSEMSERVYATVAERAKLTIREGHSAIVDAVYARPGDRQAIEHVAADVAVPFVGIWLEAPEATLIARVEQRRNDPSDADAARDPVAATAGNWRDDVASGRSLFVTRHCAEGCGAVRSGPCTWRRRTVKNR